MNLTITQMLRERPFFAKYDNFWPIRLYLLRMQSIANVRPIYRTDEEQLLFIEAFVRHVIALSLARYVEHCSDFKLLVK